jgi:hypothetical protein
VLERLIPFLFPDVGIHIPLTPVEPDLCRGILQDIEPVSCPLILCPYPELTEHMRGKRQRTQHINFVCKLFFDNGILIDHRTDLFDFIILNQRNLHSRGDYTQRLSSVSTSEFLVGELMKRSSYLKLISMRNRFRIEKFTYN